MVQNSSSNSSSSQPGGIAHGRPGLEGSLHSVEGISESKTDEKRAHGHPELEESLHHSGNVSTTSSSATTMPVSPSHDPRGWKLHEMDKAEDTADRTLIVDSGTCRHCIPHDALSEEEEKTIEALDVPLSLQAANDIIEAPEKVKIWSHDLQS